MRLLPLSAPALGCVKQRKRQPILPSIVFRLPETQGSLKNKTVQHPTLRQWTMLWPTPMPSSIFSMLKPAFSAQRSMSAEW